MHPQRPLSPYGVSKKVVGDYLVAYRELHNLEFTALALANVYGPRQDPHGEAGVAIFFAISGFLLYRPFVSARLNGAPRPAARTYLRRRILRILPALRARRLRIVDALAGR